MARRGEGHPDDGDPPARGRRISLPGAIAVVSLAIALFSAAFTVQRARQEDKGQLRADLATIMRRVTVLNGTSDLSKHQTERIALVAEARAIIPQLESVPAIYYRELGLALNATLYYREALELTDRGIRLAASTGDHVEEVYGQRLKAIIYSTSLRDATAMRLAYAKALEASERFGDGPDRLAALETRLVTFMRWASHEADLGDCARSRTTMGSARDVLNEDAGLKTRWEAEVSANQKRLEDRCPSV